ncbi:MAG: peptidylprolyl isomerase [Chitinophagales bacterium]|nr:peptidylprolyl isomerase [Bacteroidota bacterium]MCB9043942.1 peptidylprolyl isomerase [Chitinophagales bacterium]
MALISEIRKRIGLLVFLIALAIIAFLLMDIFSGPGARGSQQPIVATVNGEDVTIEEYNRVTGQAVENAQRNNPNMDEQTRLRTRESAWQKFLRDKVADSQIEELGITVTGTELMDLLMGKNVVPGIKNEPTFQNPETKQFDPQKVKDYVNSFSNGELPEQEAEGRRRVWKEFEQNVKENQIRQKYTDLVKKAIYVPRWQATFLNQNKNTKTSFNYFFVPYTTIPDGDVSVSDSDLKQYLNENKEKYQQEASVSFDFVKFPIEPSEADKQKAASYVNNLLDEFGKTTNDSIFIYRNSDTPISSAYFTAEELKAQGFTDADTLFKVPVGTILPTQLSGNFYHATKVLNRKEIPDSVKVRHILVRVNPQEDPNIAKNKIDSIYTEIQTNRLSFDEAARQFSQDASNAPKGGDLGWVKKGMMVAPFEDVIFYGAGKGAVQKVLTQFGWHLVQVTDVVTFEPGVRTALLSKEISISSETNSKIYSEANQFAGMNRTQEAFKKSAEEKGLTINTATDLKMGDVQIPNLGANDNIIIWAFKNDIGTVSNVFEVGGNYVVAVETDKKAAGIATLESVRLPLEIEVKKMKKAKKISEQLEAKKGTLQEIAGAMGQEVQSATDVTFDTPSVAGLGREAKVQAAAQALEANKVSAPIAGEQGVYLITVTQRQPAPAEADISGIQIQEDNALRGKVDFGMYEALRKAAKIQDTRYEVLTY